MGSYCFKTNSSFETLIDDVFSTLVLRKWSYEDILRELEYIRSQSFNNRITETDFQIIHNRFLFSKSYEETRSALFTYWLDFFRSKPGNLQYTMIKFNFLFLSSSTINDQKSYSEILNYFMDLVKEFKTLKSKKAMKDDEKKITVEELHFIVKDYLYSISLLPVDYLKPFHENPLEFKEKLTFSWAIEVIDCFLMKKFFSEYESTVSKVDIKKFFKNHFNVLKDDMKLRKDLTEFSANFYLNDSNKLLSHSYTMNRLNSSY